MAPGARNELGAPISEHKVFWQCVYCVSESTCDITGTLWRPPVIRRPGNRTPLPLSLRLRWHDLAIPVETRLAQVNKAECCTYFNARIICVQQL